ncbi:hypothetical protein [Pedobacter sp. KBW01]|uniref:hypothetical protein n=1 Tax=Pedobacter sp. KBW01 TaxID=2153364 RepID=UPI0018F45D06|nr:hypothetical protein [Pedobacter sp. KBW01]
MMRPFNIDNDLVFFRIGDTEGKIEYTFEGESYFNLFDFYYFQDAIEESKSGSCLSLSDTEIAKKLYDYAMNDA